MSSGKIKGITIEIGGDTTKLGKALQDVEKQSKSLQGELKGVNSLLKYDPTNVVLIKQKQDLLNGSIVQTKEKLNILKSTQAQVQAQFDKGEITEEQYRDFQREIVSTENKLKSLTKQAKEFHTNISPTLVSAGEKAEILGNKIESAGKKLTAVSGMATAALGLSAKAAIDFESSFAGVKKTVDGTTEELEEIRKGILKMSEQLPASSKEIAAVAEAARTIRNKDRKYT